MASIIGEFPEFTTAAAISRDAVTNVGGIKTTSRSSVATVECLFWEGSIAEAYVSQKFRDVTDAAIGVYASTDIQKNDIVTVDGVTYHVIGIDNIGAADELFLVALRVFA